MKEITIPEGFKPFKVVINAVEYAFTPGETVTVPDNVAECVEAYINANQDVTPEAQHQVYMLTFKPEDAGKALVVNEDGTDLVWGQAAGGDNNVFWITATVTESDGLLLNKTFLEIYNAMKSKSLCVIYVAYEDEPPTNYDAANQIITDVAYDQSAGGFVNCIGGEQYACSSVNDYPEMLGD